MNGKTIILAARIISMILTPFYLSVVGVLAIFSFSYLNMFPWQVKLSLVLLTYFFTVLIPSILIHIYRQYHGWTLFQLGHREKRMIPYVISILCYLACLYIMDWLHLPHLITSILEAALIIQILCAIINVVWKISTHTAAIGGVIGALLGFSFLFNFNPIWWLCFVILLSGLVGSSRIILRQHSLSQVSAGYFLGIISAYIAIIYF